MKNITLNLFTRLGCALLLTASTACSGVASTPNAPASVAPAAGAPAPVSAAAPAAGTLRQQMTAAIGNAACDTSAQCRSLPLGHRPCGGPEAFAAYSTKSGNAANIVRLAAEESAARKEQNERSGVMSTCQAMLDPGAVCEAGRCISGNANSAGLSTR